MNCAQDPCEFSTQYCVLLRTDQNLNSSLKPVVDGALVGDHGSRSKARTHYLLMDFPSVKLAAILVSQWLNIWELGRLDSAVCNHEHQLRVKYLKMFGPTSVISMTSSGCGITHLLNMSVYGVPVERSRIVLSADCFRFLIKRNIALTTLALTLFTDKLTLYEYLAQFGHKLLVLELCGHLANTDSWQLYFQIFNSCPKLQILLMHAQSSMICAQDVLDISEKCPQLRKLHFHNKFHLLPPRNSLKVYPKTQPNLALVGGAHLRSFSLQGYAKSTQFCVTSLAQHCGNLKILNLEGCVGLNDTALMKIANAECAIEQFVLNVCTKLTSPGLIAFFKANAAKNKHITHLLCEKVDMSDDLLMCIAEQCASLQVLNIRLCRVYTDVGLIATAQHCPQLRELYVQFLFDESITDEAVEALTQHCPLLLTLVLGNCCQLTDTAISHITTRLLSLRTLNISGRSLISEIGLIATLQNTSLWGALTSLDVSSVPTFTDHAVSAIAQMCRALRSLNISGLSGITDASIVSIATHCSSLLELQMRELIYITDSSVHELVGALGRSLRLLDLSDCAKLTDDSVVVLAMQCGRQLRVLRVRGLAALTDMSVDALTRHCLLLTDLTLSDCPLLTDTSLRYIASSLHRLLSLSVENCTRMSDSGLHSVQENCPEMHTFNKPTYR